MAEKAKIDIDGLCLKQLKMGVEVEREHTGKMGKDTKVIDSDADALKVSVAHLREDPAYYTKLKKIEKH
jgi:hypothetical protein